MRFFKYFVFSCLILSLLACSKNQSYNSQNRGISKTLNISVAPFTQPINTYELITGFIPENQGKIADDQLNQLDVILHDILSSDSSRTYTFLKRGKSPINRTLYHNSEQPHGLALWLDYGKKQNANILLIPQILNWHQREGSKAGVTSSAHVRLELFLINVKDGNIMKRAVFEEKQVGLTDNLLSVGSFFKRGGSWITAEELSREGMQQTLKDIGL